VAVALDTQPVTALRGAGPRSAALLERLGIVTVADLLFHLPLRYEDRTRIVPIGSLRTGDDAVIEGTIAHSEVTGRRRRMLLVCLEDGSGTLWLRFFHFSAAQQAQLVRGVRLRCFGNVREGQASLELIHPEYRRVSAGAPVEEHLTPIYPATEGLTQAGLRALARTALERMQDDNLPELLPDSVRHTLRLPELHDALRYVHQPPPEADTAALVAGTHPAQRRLAFEELLAHHLSLRRLRARAERQRAPALAAQGLLAQRLLAQLPFTLTRAQQRVLTEIRADLAHAHPMLRLMQGDVGSGKTVVAALAALDAIECGHQVAVMAPTELLAEQHASNFAHWLAPLGIEPLRLTARVTGRARAKLIERLAAGEIPIAIGTHALFQQAVCFAHLGLVIIDEQHRFGVHQRLALRDKGGTNGMLPHQLVMTATPIPRTLAMIAYADLDSSVIDELPPGRTPIRTVVVPESRRSDVIARVQSACAAGRQCYWVCTLIDESELVEAQAAEATAAALTEALPGVRIGLVHGRMKTPDKEHAMAAFKDGALDLLVATTVIEVGVDVANASLMIIENAERLGLAQLHQLRGRVGRGAQESSCVLLYRSPLSALARARLEVLRETSDGFAIARRDLELRGPGELLGTRQSGLLQLRIADLARDRTLLPDIERAGTLLLAEHPTSVVPLMRRWLGEAVRYAEA
jgi:ATP-dependent DNA helicase RecG